VQTDWTSYIFWEHSRGSNKVKAASGTNGMHFLLFKEKKNRKKKKGGTV